MDELDQYAGDDGHGLPLGPVRETLLQNLCAQMLQTDAPAGTYLHLLSAEVERDDDDPDSETLAVTASAHQLVGDPLRAMWGVHVDDSTSAVALHRQYDDGAMVALCTRVGDTMFYTASADGTVRTVAHGEDRDGPGISDAAVNVLRRTLGLPVDTFTVQAKALLATWTAGACKEVVTVGVGANLSDADLVAAADATAWACIGKILSDSPDVGPDVMWAVEELDAGVVNFANMGLLLKGAQQLGRKLRWSELPGSPYVQMLPEELREQSSMRWAGDGMASWWVFHVVHTPDAELDQIEAISPAAAKVVRERIGQTQWWPAPIDLLDELVD